MTMTEVFEMQLKSMHLSLPESYGKLINRRIEKECICTGDEKKVRVLFTSSRCILMSWDCKFGPELAVLLGRCVRDVRGVA